MHYIKQCNPLPFSFLSEVLCFYQMLERITPFYPNVLGGRKTPTVQV